MSFSVYFASKKVGSKLLLGTVVYEDFDQIPPIVEERRPIKGTFYEEDLLAFKQALEHILEEGYDDVTLYFHNKILFDWLNRKSHKNRLRHDLYKTIRQLFKEIVESGTRIGYEIVKGKQNEAKRELDAYAKEIPVRQDLTSMFTTADVVDFSRELRERSN